MTETRKAATTPAEIARPRAPTRRTSHGRRRANRKAPPERIPSAIEPAPIAWTTRKAGDGSHGSSDFWTGPGTITRAERAQGRHVRPRSRAFSGTLASEAPAFHVEDSPACLDSPTRPPPIAR